MAGVGFCVVVIVAGDPVRPGRAIVVAATLMMERKVNIRKRKFNHHVTWSCADAVAKLSAHDFSTSTTTTNNNDDDNIKNNTAVTRDLDDEDDEGWGSRRRCGSSPRYVLFYFSIQPY